MDSKDFSFASTSSIVSRETSCHPKGSQKRIRETRQAGRPRINSSGSRDALALLSGCGSRPAFGIFSAAGFAVVRRLERGVILRHSGIRDFVFAVLPSHNTASSVTPWSFGVREIAEPLCGTTPVKVQNRVNGFPLAAR